MNYLCNSVKFNLQELKEKSSTNADILTLFYLHYAYLKDAINLNNVVEELALDEYPQLDWNLYTVKDYGTNKRSSIYKCTNPTTEINHVEVLTSSLSDKDKVKYLELVTLCSTDTKFIPKIQVPQMLLIHGLVKPVRGGLILIKEQRRG